MKTRQSGLMAIYLLCLAGDAGAQEQHAHVHGVAKLEVVIEGNSLNLHLDSPLENIQGFEHAPRNDQERKIARTMADKLHDGGQVVVPTPDARCTLRETKLTSSAEA